MDTFRIRNTNGDKFVNIPLSLDFKNNGYSDLITRIGEEEKQKNVNLIVDAEKMRFYTAKYNTSTLSDGVEIKFYFKDTKTNSYQSNFENAGFEEDDIDDSRNRLTKSFFRLDFYDSDDEKTQNFLFSEQLYVQLKKEPKFNLDFIYWSKSDPQFIENDSYRELYFSVRFFDASNGTIKQFINTDDTSDVTLNDYKTNKGERFVKLRVLNPYMDQPLIGNKNNIFYVEPINGNTDTQITMTELNIVG